MFYRFNKKKFSSKFYGFLTSSSMQKYALIRFTYVWGVRSDILFVFTDFNELFADLADRLSNDLVKSYKVLKLGNDIIFEKE